MMRLRRTIPLENTSFLKFRATQISYSSMLQLRPMTSYSHQKPRLSRAFQNSTKYVFYFTLQVSVPLQRSDTSPYQSCTILSSQTLSSMLHSCAHCPFQLSLILWFPLYLCFTFISFASFVSLHFFRIGHFIIPKLCHIELADTLSYAAQPRAPPLSPFLGSLVSFAPLFPFGFLCIFISLSFPLSFLFLFIALNLLPLTILV